MCVCQYCHYHRCEGFGDDLYIVAYLFVHVAIGIENDCILSTLVWYIKNGLEGAQPLDRSTFPYIACRRSSSELQGQCDL